VPAPKKTKPERNIAVRFINELKHTGDFTGQPFKLRGWQEDIVRAIFDDDGKARYRTVFIALPRKQGKTELTAAILLFLMFGSGKKAQRIYSASGDLSQAALIFGAAAAMIRQSEALSAVAKVLDGYRRLEFEPAGSKYQALSSEHSRKFGLRPSVLLIDELHVLPNRDLFNALTTAFGATVDPLTIMITTAGWDRSSLCYEQWQYALGVKDGLIDDPTFLPIIYAADPGDDWTAEATWRKVMPGLGDFCQLQYIQELAKKSQEIPAYENTFRQFQLNQWTEQASRWLSVESWKACGAKFDPLTMNGCSCYVGFDHGITGDMSCVALLWPTSNGVRVFVHGWVPRDGKWRDEIRNKDRYVEWERQGFLTFTDGNAIDEDVIEKDIVAYHARYPIVSMFADRAYATRLLNRLSNNHGISVRGITQGPVQLNEACVMLEEMVISGRIEHGSNPILAWNVANASLHRGKTGLVNIDKSSSTERIDGLAAVVDALSAFIADPDNDTEKSVYEDRGIISLEIPSPYNRRRF
jgi:phage terminase large subunit-like protein